MVKDKGSLFFSFFRYVLVLYILLFSMLIMTLIPAVFGHEVRIYEGHDREGDIPAGSVIISKKVPHREIGKGDIILVDKDTGREQNGTPEEQFAYYTMPVDGKADLMISFPKQQQVYEKYLYHIPFVGYMLGPIKRASTPIFMCCILLYLFTYTVHQSKEPEA